MKSSKSPDANVMISKLPPSGVPMYDDPTRGERMLAMRKPAVPTRRESLRIVLAAAPAAFGKLLPMFPETYLVAGAGGACSVGAEKAGWAVVDMPHFFPSLLSKTRARPTVRMRYV